jgi:tetratricopeptide (TPR) repeat protein
MRRQVLNAADAGEGDPAVRRLRAILAAEPGNPAPRLELAAYFGRNGQPELELEHLRLAVDRFPASRDAHLALAQALRKAGEPRQGAALLTHYLRANPGSTADPELWNCLGVAHDEAGDWPAGEQAFRSALAVAPDLDYLLNNLGYNLLEQGRTSEAVAILKDAVRRNPRSETARNNLGMALARLQGVPLGEALQHFENVADAATARSNLAAALIEQQRYEESRRLLEAALDYNRSHAVALANLALLAELDGRPVTVHPPAGRITPWRRPVALLKKILQGDKP